MQWSVILLRLAHIVLGALWLGMMVFSVAFLTPAARELGSRAQPMMAAIQRRRLTLAMSLMALGTIGSGIALMQTLYGDMSRLHGSPTGMAFMFGGAAAIAAFLIGVIFMRPAMARITQRAEQLHAAEGEQDPAAGSAEILRLHGRFTIASRVATALLVFAAGAMAVARYL